MIAAREADSAPPPPPALRILIVEDDPQTRSLLALGLQESGYTCDTVADGAEGLAQLESRQVRFDLILLDLMMPVCDGWQFLEALRSRGDRTPVVVLTARHEVDERVRGLHLGADDYVIKPFAFSELLARIRAIGRRTTSRMMVGDLCLDLDGRFAECAGRRLEMSPKEFGVLLHLARHPGFWFSRRDILQHVWGVDFDPGTNIVDVTIGRLRRRIAGSAGVTIETSRGQGYSLVLQAVEAPGGG